MRSKPATHVGVCGRALSSPLGIWRHRNAHTIVLGSIAVPITAQAELLAPASAAQAPSLGCIIKGNLNRKGERIYFRPVNWTTLE